jgi:transposase
VQTGLNILAIQQQKANFTTSYLRAWISSKIFLIYHTNLRQTMKNLKLNYLKGGFGTIKWKHNSEKKWMLG